MARTIGYARVSTGDQTTALQLDALRVAGADPILEDVASGAKLDRRGLAEALALLEEGDTLLVWRLDRLGRSLRQLIETVETVRARGAFLRSLTDGIDTSTSAGRMMYAVMSALAEFERETIRERVTAGIQASRRAGKPHGRASTMTPERTDHARRLLAEGQTWATVARLCGVSKTSLVRAFKRHPAKP